MTLMTLALNLCAHPYSSRNSCRSVTPCLSRHVMHRARVQRKLSIKAYIGPVSQRSRSSGPYLQTDLNPAPRISTPNQTELKSLSHVTNGERKNGEGTEARSFYAFSLHPSPHFSLAVFYAARHLPNAWNRLHHELLQNIYTQ